AAGRTFQEILGFRTSLMGNADVHTTYARPVSYGIRRSEFDHYLLLRSGAHLLEGEPAAGLAWEGDHWLCNGRIRARLVVGAGGHFCPVAKALGAVLKEEVIVAAQEL